MERHSFRVERFEQLQGGWKILEIDDQVPLSAQEKCPGDGVALRTLATFVGNNGSQRMRYGLCPTCGYAGYIDRPTHEWMVRFYADLWEEAEGQLIADAEVKKLREGFSKRSAQESMPEMLRTIEKLSIDKSRYICDIGSGPGDYLKTFEALGYKVVGVENSKRRATFASKVHAINIIAGAFEDPKTQQELKKYTPLSFVYSHAVLEHVYDPSEIISCASQLQSEGDYILTVVPDVWTESAMTCIFFLPHLHDYSAGTLTHLMNAHGYRVIDTSQSNREEQWVVGQKASRQVAAPYSKISFEDALKKFTEGLALSRGYLRSTRRLWWEKNFGDAKSSLYFKRFPKLNALYFRFLLKLNRILRSNESQKIHSCIVSNVAKRFTTQEESPIEIQYNGNIKLLYK